jgi:hypothetical protein
MRPHLATLLDKMETRAICHLTVCDSRAGKWRFIMHWIMLICLYINSFSYEEEDDDDDDDDDDDIMSRRSIKLQLSKSDT